MDWYKKKIDETAELFSSDIKKGLSSEKANKALEKYGRNELKQEEKKPLIEKLKDQFLDPMIIILIIASILSAFTGDKVEAVIIIAIVVVNAILSLYQEGRAEKAIAALQKMSSPKAKIIRDGREMEIESGLLVPGDLVVLETGDIVPGDLRLIESQNLKIDESSLTGESVPVEKDAKKVYTQDEGIGDRKNIAYSSTVVSYGRGKGLIVATGHQSEIGKIATSIALVDNEETPLQKKLAGLSKTLGLLVIGICIIVFIVGKLYKNDTLKGGDNLANPQLVETLATKALAAYQWLVKEVKVNFIKDRVQQFGGHSVPRAVIPVGNSGYEMISKLEKYFSNKLEANVYANAKVYKNGTQKIEITVPMKGVTLRAEETNSDLYSAVDLVIDKLERQMRKYKTKINRKSREKGILAEALLTNELDGKEDLPLEFVKVKKVKASTMNKEEAILQMELIGHDFFVYTDEENNNVSIAYKRKDGKYGVIEVENK